MDLGSSNGQPDVGGDGPALRHGVVPARPGRPQDKAEAAVYLAVGRIPERLRNERFTSLAELNARLAGLRERINAAPFQKRPESRRELFELLDRPALQPLPAQPYEFAEWRVASVLLDCHAAVEGDYYLAPVSRVRRQVDLRLTGHTVELLHNDTRAALHVLSHERRWHTTCPQHRPRAHHEHLRWTPERLRRWASGTGPHTERLVAATLVGRRFPSSTSGAAWASCGRPGVTGRTARRPLRGAGSALRRGQLQEHRGHPAAEHRPAAPRGRGGAAGHPAGRTRQPARGRLLPRRGQERARRGRTMPVQPACRDSRRALYTRAPQLFRDLLTARAEGTLTKLPAKLARVSAVAVDDFALTPMEEADRRDFLDLCDDRHLLHATILTSQLKCLGFRGHLRRAS